MLGDRLCGLVISPIETIQNLASETSFFGVPTSFLLDFFFFFFLVPESPLGAGDAPRGGREGGGVSQGIAQKLVPRTSVAIEGLLL